MGLLDIELSRERIRDIERTIAAGRIDARAQTLRRARRAARRDAEATATRLRRVSMS